MPFSRMLIGENHLGLCDSEHELATDMPALNQSVSLSRVLQSEHSINGRFELAVICEVGYSSHLLTRGMNDNQLKTHPILRSKLLAKGFYAQMAGERDNPTATFYDF